MDQLDPRVTHHQARGVNLRAPTRGADGGLRVDWRPINNERAGHANPPYKNPAGGLVMNIELRQPDLSQKTRLKVIDVDIHPKSAMEDLRPYLAKRWWDHYTTYR